MTGVAEITTKNTQGNVLCSTSKGKYCTGWPVQTSNKENGDLVVWRCHGSCHLHVIALKCSVLLYRSHLRALVAQRDVCESRHLSFSTRTFSTQLQKACRRTKR